MLYSCENHLQVHGRLPHLRGLRDVLTSMTLQADEPGSLPHIRTLADGLVVTYRMRREPALDALAVLADRFQSMSFTLLYFQRERGMRGYAVYGPRRARRSGREENIALDAEPQLFPPYYSLSRLAEAWDADRQSRTGGGR